MTPAMLDVANDLSTCLDWQDMPWSSVQVTHSETALSTHLPIADIASIAQGAVGLTAAAIFEMRTGRAQSVHVDRRRASLSMTDAAYLTVDGKPAVEWDPLTGYYQAADGWVYLHTAFTHLRQGLLDEFALPEDRAAVERHLCSLSAQEIEDRAAQRGVCAIKMRDRSTWARHPHSMALRRQPLISMSRHGNSPARALGTADTPLSGVRVLDLSRVIAGPMIGRTLAEHGADVLRVGAAHLPSIPSLVISTGFGKRSVFLDLETRDGRDRLSDLVRECDIVIDGYRPGALRRHGFSFEGLSAMNPSLVYVTLSAFGEAGPWAGRRGFDTYVQAATGLCQITGDGPQRLPCQPLDYLTGYLGAAAAMAALRRRASSGGAWRCELSLARMAEWIWACSDRLAPEENAPLKNPAQGDLADYMATVPSRFGTLCTLVPAVDLSLTPGRWQGPPVPLGSDTATWRN